jgi:hypothetical protein
MERHGGIAGGLQLEARQVRWAKRGRAPVAGARARGAAGRGVRGGAAGRLGLGCKLMVEAGHAVWM